MKINKKLIIIVILLIVLLIIYFYYINNINNINTIQFEPFSSNFVQNGNVIYHKQIQISLLDNEPTISKSNNKNFDIYKINLDKNYKITDFYLDIGSNNVIQVGIFNTNRNLLNFVNFNTTSAKIDEQITVNISSSTITNVKDIYNNDIYGNQIQLFVKTETKTEIENLTITICGIESNINIHQNKMDYLINKSSIITDLDNNNKLLSNKEDELLYTNLNNSNLNNNRFNLPIYNITQIDFSQYITNQPNEIIFSILYINSYTNEVLTYNSDRNDNKFIITREFPSIIIYNNILLANKIYLKVDNNVRNNINNIKVRGYKGNINDINQFKLQNNITDIRGSINPTEVCPSIDNLLQGQLNAETIIDAMDYLEKIKDEKIKLQSNKELLLTLIEQKEDISRLGNILDKIDTLKKQRNMETDALNAIKLTKQIDEINKLREVLDARIELNKRNTYNIDKVALNIYRNPSPIELELMKNELITLDNSNDIEVNNDGFTDFKRKIPIDIEENMKV